MTLLIPSGDEILKKLAEGIFADVFLVKSATGCSYIAKVFKVESELFLNEISVNKYLGLIESEHENGFTMLYEEGEDLFDRIHDIPWKEYPDIMIKIVEELIQLHSKHIIHFDIKPENIFISNKGTVKILDYGLARTCNKEISKKWNIKLVDSEDSMGTVYYVAPEVISKKYSDYTAVDVYSLGVTFYCLIEKSFPYLGEGVSYIENVVRCKPEPMIARANEAVKHIVMSMMEKNPKKRPSLLQVRNVLKQI